jgi:hypothetical protein
MYGNWARNLDKDLNTLVGDYATDCLVSLLPQAECETLGIGKLLHKVGTRRLSSVHLPLALDAVPSAAQHDAILRLARDVARRWSAGETVVMHCRYRAARLFTHTLMNALCDVVR